MHSTHTTQGLVSEPDPLHGMEEGSWHVPTFELSSRNAIMSGN